MAVSLYVLGHPVAHSKSPVMHNAAYKALGLDWHYDFMDCASLDEARFFLARESWLALNITMPYKPLAYESARVSSDAARLAGGANVLVRCPDGLHADNTDGKGCVSYLRRCGVAFEGARIVVCGTGPTSRALLHAALQAGARNVALLGRDETRAQLAREAYVRQTRACSDVVAAGSYEGSRSVLADADIILDATPLGMKAGDLPAFDTGLLSSGQVVFDVVYGHGETALARASREAGCVFYDGRGMLVAQAVETVYDIQRVTELFEVPASLDLFEIMAKAAGFTW